MAARRTEELPPAVFEVFNEAIAQAWTGERAVVYQGRAADAVAAKLGVSRGDVFALRYLDVEDAYRAEGWVVEYDKPGYNETYEPSFTFRRPGR